MITETETIPGKRILLVEDERAVRETVRGFLIKDSFLVTEANNGAEAYTLFTKGHFDLVLTDCAMPFVSGDELALRIRRVAPQQPILMLTGIGYRRSRSNPVDAVLQKPFDYDSLHQEIAKLLPLS
jgi:DNA-binding response OmpR family regulator